MARKPDFIEIAEGHVIATRGIMAIKQRADFIEVRYITGFSEEIRGISMTELLDKLGRNPLTRGDTDSGRSSAGA